MRVETKIRPGGKTHAGTITKCASKPLTSPLVLLAWGALLLLLELFTTCLSFFMDGSKPPFCSQGTKLAFRIILLSGEILPALEPNAKRARRQASSSFHEPIQSQPTHHRLLPLNSMLELYTLNKLTKICHVLSWKDYCFIPPATKHHWCLKQKNQRPQPLPAFSRLSDQVSGILEGLRLRRWEYDRFLEEKR